MSPADFRTALLAYCDAMDASETSVKRTPTHSVAVGGKHNDSHVFGLGGDVVYDARPSLDEARRVAALFGLRVLREPTHDHLQPLGAIFP